MSFAAAFSDRRCAVRVRKARELLRESPPPHRREIAIHVTHPRAIVLPQVVGR